MAPQKDYKGLIWTNHVIDRLKERKIPQEWAWKTYRFPDMEIDGKEAKTKELQKRIEDRTVTVITKKNERNESLLLSCWVEPPFPGSIDAKRSFYPKKKEAPILFRFLKWIRSALSSKN
jgi:hypothetical protein